MHAFLKYALAGFLFLTIFTLPLEAQVPEWIWARGDGGNQIDEGRAVATDARGNLFAAGFFSDSATIGGVKVVGQGGLDIYVARFLPDGNLAWVQTYGGPDDDYGFDIVVSDSGAIYLAGCFRNTATFSNQTVTSAGSDDIYLARLDSMGNCQWVRRGGGVNSDIGFGLALDDAGAAYLTGNITLTAWFGTDTLTARGDEDIFLAKYDPSGNRQWVRNTGGTGFDRGYGVDVDSLGNSYIGGFFASTGFFGPDTLVAAGNFDAFALSYDNMGNIRWARQGSSSSDDYGLDIVCDRAGNNYLLGYFSLTAGFGTQSVTSGGLFDIFVAAYDAQGTIRWVEGGGSTNNDFADAIDLDQAGNLWIGGRIDGNAQFDTLSVSPVGFFGDALVVSYTPQGNVRTGLAGGGSLLDRSYGLCTSPDGAVYTTGSYSGSASFGASNLTAVGNLDVFIARFGELAIEPAAAPSGMRLDSISCSSMRVRWTSGSGAGRVLVAREGTAVQFGPRDGFAYASNGQYGIGTDLGGGAFVVYSGTGQEAQVTGLRPGQHYFFKLYEFNGSNAGINYLEQGAPEVDSTSLAAIQASISPADTARFCEGDTAVLSGPAGGESYIWIKDGNLPFMFSNPDFSVTMPGSYSLVVVTPGGCRDTAANSVIVIQDSLPNARFQYVYPGNGVQFFPEVNDSIGYTYNWNLDQGLTSTLISPTAAYTGTDTFLVCLELGNRFGCKAVFCDSVPFPNVGIEQESEALHFIVYPNPARDRILLEHTGTEGGRVELALLGIRGEVHKTWDALLPGGGRLVLPLEGLPEGFYLLRLKRGTLYQSWKIRIRP